MTSTTSSNAHMLDHPTERMTDDLATAVEGALWAYAPMRQSNSTVAVTTADGVVTISGNVLSASMKTVAGLLVQNMPAVTGVVNELYADPNVERDVAMALALDPETRLYTDTLLIKCLRGSLYLGGTVTAPELEQAEAVVARAATLAAAIDGVREVFNGAEAAVGVTEEAMATAPTPATDDTSAAEKLAMDERIAIWRERLAAKG